MKFPTVLAAIACLAGTAFAVCEDLSGYSLCTNGLTIGDENCCDSAHDGRVSVASPNMPYEKLIVETSSVAYRKCHARLRMVMYVYSFMIFSILCTSD